MKKPIKKTLDRAGIRPTGLNLNTEWPMDFLYHLTDFRGSLGDALAACLKEGGALPEHQAKLRTISGAFAPYGGVVLSPTQDTLVR